MHITTDHQRKWPQWKCFENWHDNRLNHSDLSLFFVIAFVSNVIWCRVNANRWNYWCLSSVARLKLQHMYPSIVLFFSKFLARLSVECAASCNSHMCTLDGSDVIHIYGTTSVPSSLVTFCRQVGVRRVLVSSSPPVKSDSLRNFSTWTRQPTCWRSQSADERGDADIMRCLD